MPTNNYDLEKILACRHHDPFHYLGAHFGTPDSSSVTVRCFQPHAREVSFLHGDLRQQMERIHPDGVFAITLLLDSLEDPLLDPYTYRFELILGDNDIRTINDPYRFEVHSGEQDRFLFNAGRHYRLYDYLGAHLIQLHTIDGVIFRVWAPNSAAVSVVGDFNRWDGRVHQMRSLGASGIWELFVPHLESDALYKFQITTQNGNVLLKADPFQFYGELRPQNSSRIRSLDNYRWRDQAWQESNKNSSPYQKPLAIYEAHLGSWRRDPASPERFLTYVELAEQLVPYVKGLGFTHIELMPIMEHPLDESWGYQVTAPFSTTSRYGTPEEFMFFVDTAHQHGIGVILDWVPAHFPKDDHSLGRFDGTALYEHEDERKGAHPEWGTLIYNYGRNEVSNYLIANALFWLDKFHIDGLRVDAVASMLYLDYSRREGEWVPNRHGGRENLEAIEFMRHLNAIVYQYHPNTLMIAEESTAFYGVSKPADKGGLGFGFKWNMGWMNDTLLYFSTDPIYRKYHHNNLTFSLMYAFSENFILPLSHDEVVHGKKSLVDKMPGDIWQKFANLRLLLLSMYMHPGKKLLFMGSEFGQWAEWYCKTSLDWHLLNDHELHGKLQNYVTSLNMLYLDSAPLWQLDFDPAGFTWLDLEDRDNSIICFARFASERDDHLVCLLNYTPQVLHDYRIPLVEKGRYKLIFNSDDLPFGGSGTGFEPSVDTIDFPHGQGACHARVTVPPLAGLVLKPL